MDIDLDFKTTFDPLEIFDAVRASRVNEGALVKHNVGVYFQDIPIDPLTGFSAIPYKEAEEVGYFKIDFLHLNVLDHFETKDEIKQLLAVEPDWSLLGQQEAVEKLFQIHNYYDIISRIMPKSIPELAECIALIRPAKHYLINAYLKDPNAIRSEIWTKPEDGKYYFKKSHATAYAMTIVLQLHLIKGGIV